MISLILAGICAMSLNKTPAPVRLLDCVTEAHAPSMSFYVEHETPEFSEADITLMHRVVMSEASTQSMECKEAVATTILNRYFSPTFCNSIPQIVADAYSTQDNGIPNEDCYVALMNAIEHWDTPDQVVPWCCYYFRGDHYHEWAQDYRRIDDLYFSVPKDACLD